MSVVRLGKPVLAVLVGVVAIAGLATASLAAWTARAEGTAGAVAERLGTPGAVSVTAVDQQALRISWAPPAGPLPTGYVVRRVGSPSVTVCTSAVAAGDRLECTDTGLTEDTTYGYTVQAVLHAWQGPESAPVSDTTGSAPEPDAGPRLLRLEMRDVDADGKVDQVLAVFDEALQSNPNSETTQWALTNAPSGGTKARVNVSGNTATLTLNAGAGPADTALGSFTVTLTASSTGVRDLEGNPAAFAATAPADKAGPVIMSLADQAGAKKGATTGKPEAGDTLDFTFSETVSLPSSPVNVALQWSSNTNSTLSIPGVTQGSMQLGAGYFEKTGNKSGTFSESTLTRVNGDRTIRLILGAYTGEPTATGPGGVASVAPVAGVVDAAGNAAAGSYTSPAMRFF